MGIDRTQRDSRALSAFMGINSKRRSGPVETWLSDMSQLNFVPKDAKSKFLGLDTVAVGNAEGSESHDAGSAILVTTGIGHDSFTIDKHESDDDSEHSEQTKDREDDKQETLST
jgi:hypothetical protein